MNPYTGSVNSRELVKTDSGFPIKLYNFRSALTAYPNTDAIKRSLKEVSAIYPEIFSNPYLYSIALAWAYRENKKQVGAFDIFGYKFDKHWRKCNPDVDPYVIKDGIYDPTDKTVTCETGTIVLGAEGKLRRLCKGLNQFLNRWPNIGELGPVVKQ